jgi:integrase/recombinase XerD
MKLLQALDGFLLSKRIEGLSPRTLEGYERQIQLLAEFVGNPPIQEITTNDLRRFFDYLRHDYTPQRLTGNTEPLSAQTIRNYWIALRSFWSFATEELGVSDAMAAVPAPKTSEAVISPFKPQEVKDMLEACKRTKDGRRHPSAYRNTAILVTLADSGLRNSELRSLTISDYNEKTGRMDVRGGKGGRNRVVFVGTVARKALWRYLVERDDRYDPDAPLFASSDGSHLSRSRLYKLIAEIGERAGVQGATVHRFRHFFATQYLRNSGDIYALKRVLGHSSLEMVKRYAAVADVDLELVHRRASPVDNL